MLHWGVFGPDLRQYRRGNGWKAAATLILRCGGFFCGRRANGQEIAQVSCKWLGNGRKLLEKRAKSDRKKNVKKQVRHRFRHRFSHSYEVFVIHEFRHSF